MGTIDLKNNVVGALVTLKKELEDYLRIIDSFVLKCV